MNYNFAKMLTNFFCTMIPYECSNINFMDELRKYNFHTIAPWLISGLKSKTAEENKAKTIVYQAMFANQLKSEYIKLIKAFTDHNLKVISFKGFAISSSVYPIYPRIFTDNDFLCKETDIPIILGILDKLGYKYKTGQNYISPINIEISKEKEWFQIGFTNNMKSGSFPVEIHKRLMPRSMGIDLDIENIIRRANSTIIFGQETLVMEIHDRIIFLILHFIKDYRYQINWVLQGDMKHYIDIRKLYDIALLLEKYKEEFNWEVFIERIMALDIVLELKYAFRFFDEIFSELIPKVILEELNNLPYNTNRLLCEYLDDLIKCDLKKLMIFEIKDELRSILKKDKNRPEICSNSTKFICMENRIEKETIKTNANPIKEIFDTKIKIEHNDNYLFIYLKYTGIGNLPQLSFKLINPDQKEISDVTMNCSIDFQGEDEGILIVYDYVTPIKSETDIIYKHTIKKAVTNIQLGLPWNCLNINIDIKKVIFNAMIRNVNPGVSETDYILFGKNWDSVENCGYLILN